MKKFPRIQVLILIVLALASIAGFFLRRYQLVHELQANGSLANGSYMHILLSAAAALLVVFLIFALRPLPKKSTCSEVFPTTILPGIMQIVCVTGLLIGNSILLPTGASSSSTTNVFFAVMEKALPLLGILCAICIAAFAILRISGRKPSPLLYMVASVYLIVRLILDFQQWGTDPSVHDYAFSLLADICCMIGTYQLAGFSFGRGKRRLTLFWTLCAVFFCAITLADTLHSSHVANTLITFSLGCSLLVSSMQLLLYPKHSKPLFSE